MDLKQQTETMLRALERRMEQEADAGEARLREERRDSTMPQPEGGAAWREWIARRSARVAKEDGR